MVDHMRVTRSLITHEPRNMWQELDKGLLELKAWMVRHRRHHIDVNDHEQDPMAPFYIKDELFGDDGKGIMGTLQAIVAGAHLGELPLSDRMTFLLEQKDAVPGRATVIIELPSGIQCVIPVMTLACMMCAITLPHGRICLPALFGDCRQHDCQACLGDPSGASIAAKRGMFGALYANENTRSYVPRLLKERGFGIDLDFTPLMQRWLRPNTAKDNEDIIVKYLHKWRKVPREDAYATCFAEEEGDGVKGGLIAIIHSCSQQGTFSDRIKSYLRIFEESPNAISVVEVQGEDPFVFTPLQLACITCAYVLGVGSICIRGLLFKCNNPNCNACMGDPAIHKNYATHYGMFGMMARNSEIQQFVPEFLKYRAGGPALRPPHWND